MSTVVARVYWALRWFGREFLWIDTRLEPSAVLMNVSRLIGIAVVLIVARLAMGAGLATTPLEAIIQCVLAVALGLLIGNLTRELAIDLFARAMALLLRDFTRIGATLDGKTYRETLHADGTWIRCVSGRTGCVCEWTDQSGACYQITTGPRNPPRS
jgi:uncharacterized protein YacL